MNCEQTNASNNIFIERMNIYWWSTINFENLRKLTLIIYHENCEILAHFNVVLRCFILYFSKDMCGEACFHTLQLIEEVSSNLKICRRMFQKYIFSGRNSSLFIFSNGWRQHQRLNCFQNVFLLFIVLFCIRRMIFPRELLKRVNIRTKHNVSAEYNVVNELLLLWINIKSNFYVIFSILFLNMKFSLWRKCYFATASDVFPDVLIFSPI